MTPEQQALMALASESLQEAKVLLEHDFYRAVVSRAYYSMFYVASAMLQSENVEVSKHSAVIAEFGRKFARTGQIPPEFHRYLIDAEDSRIESDYKYMLQITEEQAELQIEYAEKFIQMGEKFFTSNDAKPENSQS